MAHTMDDNRLLYVLAIERYMSDPTHRGQLGIPDSVDAALDVMQLTVSNGENKLKMILDGRLNILVQRHELQAGSTIRLVDFKLHLDETSHGGADFIVLRKLKVLKKLFARDDPEDDACLADVDRTTNTDIAGPSQPMEISDEEDYDYEAETAQYGTRVTDFLDHLFGRKPPRKIRSPAGVQNPLDLLGTEWLESFCDQHPTEGPITSSRGYFNSVWSSVEVCGDPWILDKPIRANLGNLHGDIMLLRELHQNLCPNPLVCVKVLLKFRISHFPKPYKRDKWPLQARVLVGDCSGVCTMVLWNKMVPEWYYSLKVGDVVTVKKFAIKRSFRQIDAQKLKKAIGKQRLMDFELSVNQKNPEAQLIKMDPASIPVDIDLPPVIYDLKSRRTTGSLPENTIIDVAGVIIHVGRYEREPMIKHGKDSGCYWVRQWVFLKDGTSNLPFVVQVYNATIGLSEVNIQPGKLLLCSNVRVVTTNVMRRASRAKRYFCLSSTEETEVRNLIEKDVARMKEPLLNDLVRWSKSRECRHDVENGSVGGYYQGLPLPHVRDEALQIVKNDQPIPSHLWSKFFASLRYREVRRVSVYASLAYIHYHPGGMFEARQANMKFTVSPSADDPDPTRLGRDHLDLDETFPLLYSQDRWPEMKQKLDFPCMDLHSYTHVQNGGPFEVRHQPYFTFLFMGLNHPTMLYTHLICRHKINKDCSITDILSGQIVSDDDGPEASYEEIQTILATGGDLYRRKLHVILDLYQYSANSTEIIVNRAYKTDSQTLTDNWQAQLTQSQPQPTQSQPQSTQSQHQSTQSQPQPTQSQPQPTQSQPQLTQSQPQSTQSQPQSTQSQPQSTQSQPQSTQSQHQPTQSQHQPTQSQPQSTQSHQPTISQQPPVKLQRLLGTSRTSSPRPQPHKERSLANVRRKSEPKSRQCPTVSGSSPRSDFEPHPVDLGSFLTDSSPQLKDSRHLRTISRPRSK